MKHCLMVACYVALAACSYRPARFADAPALLSSPDDAPIPMPRAEGLDERQYLAEVYMRQPVMESLDVSRPPEAGDVNSIDEVVRSSWFNPDSTRQSSLAGYSLDGPPRFPLRVVRGADGPTLSVVDARGLAYRLRKDLPDRAEMRTAADAVTSRLLWAVGYLTPEVHVVQVHADNFAAGSQSALAWLGTQDKALRSLRVAATRWPIGTDLGPASAALTREDDPNDQIHHRNRRSLRALRAMGAWLDLKTLGPHKTLDAYVGSPGCAHVVHYFLGFEDALGAARVSVKVAPGTARPDIGPDPLLNLFTLGLYPNPPPSATERKFRTLGGIDVSVNPASYHPDLPPYEPVEHALAPDGYWASRRIMALAPSVIAAAVEGGVLTEPEAAARLVEIIEARRRKVARWWLLQVTPVRITAAAGISLLMHDDYVALGFAQAESVHYRVEFLDEQGGALGRPLRMVPKSPCWTMTLPETALSPYLVMRVTVVRDGVLAARSAEFHLVVNHRRAHVVGMRH